MPNYRYPTSNCMRQGTQGVRHLNGMSTSQTMTETGVSVKCKDNLSDMQVAMAYVPWSHWQDIYEPEKAFRRGTIFRNLDKPFRGAGGCQNVR